MQKAECRMQNAESRMQKAESIKLDTGFFLLPSRIYHTLQSSRVNIGDLYHPGINSLAKFVDTNFPFRLYPLSLFLFF